MEEAQPAEGRCFLQDRARGGHVGEEHVVPVLPVVPEHLHLPPVLLLQVRSGQQGRAGLQHVHLGLRTACLLSPDLSVVLTTTEATSRMSAGRGL